MILRKLSEEGIKSLTLSLYPDIMGVEVAGDPWKEFLKCEEIEAKGMHTIKSKWGKYDNSKLMSKKRR